ncbi:hypothetical protein TNCT_154511 [Trichonephila clavata]|uniref:Uncharacterized protein n=1 Tax=Trichonephila clavata TaxID=2740835 RepID=A0A8X6FVY6_TRICU|nr:hypothetical protein TNCT_154511 [Trichonephila clavata]
MCLDLFRKASSKIRNSAFAMRVDAVSGIGTASYYFDDIRMSSKIHFFPTGIVGSSPTASAFDLKKPLNTGTNSTGAFFDPLPHYSNHFLPFQSKEPTLHFIVNSCTFLVSLPSSVNKGTRCSSQISPNSHTHKFIISI